MSLLIEKTDKTMIFKDIEPVSRDEAKALCLENAESKGKKLSFVPNNQGFLALALGYTTMAINHMTRKNPETFKYNMKVWNSLCEDEVQWLNPFIKDWIPKKLQKHIDKISFDYIDYMYNERRRWKMNPIENEFKEWLDGRKY